MAISPAGAAAHAGLLSSEPDAGARLAASPEAVRLTFSERPEASLSEIRVFGTGGAPEQLGRPRPASGDPLTLEVPVRRLGKGVYTVRWKIVSADDGHATEGTFAFGVRASPTGVAASEGTTVDRSSRFEFLARWIFLLGAIALTGGAVAGIAGFGGPPGRDLALAAGGWALAVAGLLLLADAQRVTAGSSLGALLDTSIGTALNWRAAALAAAGLALLAAWKWPRLRRAALAAASVAALGLIVAHAGAGHAAAGSWPSAVAISAQVAHFAAAGVWIGGLAALILGFRGASATAKEEAVRRFAPIALGSALIVFATGVLRAVDELTAWGDLTGTSYGRAVLAKLVLFVLIAAIAARNRPRKAPVAPGDLEAMRRRSKLELALAVVAIALAALLGTLGPPGSGRAQIPPGLPVHEPFVSILRIPGSPKPPQYTMQTDDGYIRISPDPERPGRSKIYVSAYSIFENPVPTSRVVVTAGAPGEPPKQLPVHRLGNSRFVAIAELQAGPVEIGVVARTRSGSRLRGLFKIDVPG